MLGLDNTNQYIDWWHEALPGSGEGFDHEGTLISMIMRPSITLGLSNYWNLTIIQNIGIRTMRWEGDSVTIHHRNEGSHTDFSNANGGLLGDSRIMARYLIVNDGRGPGKRWFIGTGLILPSRNTLTSDPFFLNNEEKDEHRHFSISEGVHKGVLEMQLFIKRMTTPVFIGGTLSAVLPLKESKYGFKASESYDLSVVAFSKLIPAIKGSAGANLVMVHTTESYWNGKEAPNSRATVVTAGFGILWNTKIGGFAFNIQKPFFIGGSFSGIEGELEQKVGAWQVSMSLRSILSNTVSWLDPFKDL